VIHNALPPPAAPGQSRTEIRAELGWPDQPTLVTVARLQPWKGIDHLIAAISGMTDLRLIIAGAGPDRSRLEALAKPLRDRVVFAGQLASNDVHRLMVAADGLALYSGYEGLSHTLLESLRLGTPVLASDKGGNSELVHHGVNGVLVPYVDMAALRRGIQQLMQRRDEFAENCRVSLERFSFRTMVGETHALLKSLL
jgi:glycosyltransferase involved in cell wall biosynthesis